MKKWLRRASAVRPLVSKVWRLVLICAALASGCTPSRQSATGRTAHPSPSVAAASAPAPDLAARIRAAYVKSEHQIPMRDGLRLFTTIYQPRDQSRAYPFLLIRTPYSVSPYGADAYRESLGPSDSYADDGYIFVYQDVRGCYMSEGTFVNMTPHVREKRSPADVDESSDTRDTIEWLLENVSNHNGRVGMWGISYPGFYAAAGMIDAHPALKAVSPQAPIADWWFDDFHHHGALFLPHAFNFLASFGQPRPQPTTQRGERFEHGTPDGYAFFRNLGPLRNANEQHFKGDIQFWNDLCAHPNYDEFWQARNLLPHLHRIAPAVLTVGGWFDAENLYGALNIYRTAEAHNPGVFNALVMGPWQHGGWNRTPGRRLGNIDFGSETSQFYREEIERPFFAHFLKDAADPALPEASAFDTGAHRWMQFDAWPPAGLESRTLYVQAKEKLVFARPPADAEAFDQYISNPARPVPFSQAISTGMTREYMTDDQRFAARRPDVLTYQTEAFDEDMTIAGPVTAELWVSTSGTDSDWIVKLIDVFPPDAPDFEGLAPGIHMGEYQMMVRSEVMRGRFRNSYEHPEPFVPDEPTLVRVPLQEVLHTFRKGHRLMIQIQSTWFPLVDLNPHRYVDNIYLDAREDDFISAVQRVYREADHPTRILFGTLNADSLPAATSPAAAR